MRSYGFSYIEGHSRPHGTITAKDDAEFYRKLKSFLSENGRILMRGSITVQEWARVPDPSPADYDRDEVDLFFQAGLAHDAAVLGRVLHHC